MKSIITGLLIVLLLACSKEENPTAVVLDGPSFLSHQLGHTTTADIQALTLEQQIGQLLIRKQKGVPGPAIVALIRAGQLGGLQFSHIHPDSFLLWRDSLQAISPHPLYISLEGEGHFNAAFEESSTIPSWWVWQASGIDSLGDFADQMFEQQLEQLGVNWLLMPGIAASLAEASSGLAQNYSLCDEAGRLGIVQSLPLEAYTCPDSSAQELALMQKYASLINWGLSGLKYPLNTEERLTHYTAFSHFFRARMHYGGLFIAEADTVSMAQLKKLAASDGDVLLTSAAPHDVAKTIKAAMSTGLISKAWLQEKVEKNYRARSWAAHKQKPKEAPANNQDFPLLQASLAGASKKIEKGYTSLQSYFSAEDWAYWDYMAQASALVLATDPQGLVPLALPSASGFSIIHYTHDTGKAFNEAFGKYAAYKSWKVEDGKGLERLLNRTNERSCHIIVIDDMPVDSTQAALLNELGQSSSPVIVVNFGQADNLAYLDSSLVVIQSFAHTSLSKKLVPQLLFGSLPAKGRLPYTISPAFVKGQGLTTDKIRLEYGIPQQQGLTPQALVGIDAIVHTAIKDKIFPGAQVLVAKGGNVVYQKSFGYHTYAQKRAVNDKDLYDLASITKVAATSLVAMKAYEDKQYELGGKLKHYLPMKASSKLKHITPRQLLSHRTGLQPHMPVVPYLLSRDTQNANCDLYFCKSPSEEFPIQVADSFFFSSQYHRQMLTDMHQLRPKRTKFRYSDANFVLLQQLLEHKGKNSLDSLAYKNFYQPLGLRYTLFKPLSAFPRRSIVPTQKDERWRYQLLQGYVHDETAGLLGGVAGHAGLFSNAADLAVILQLLLNEGQYGGHQFLKPSTIKLFTAAKHGNHRGLGFDKPKAEDIEEGDFFPKAVSTNIYGHKGFTGGCVWVDPQNELIYIFLSNRVYPDAYNKQIFRKRIRERVHQVIYKALDTYSPPALPLLAMDR
jgi:CubicO group peptidase (beta-lactamase class C family)